MKPQPEMDMSSSPTRDRAALLQSAACIVPSESARSSSSERGASAVEYGLLIAGIAAIIAIAVFAFGGGSTGMFQNSCKTIFTDRSIGSCSR